MLLGIVGSQALMWLMARHLQRGACFPSVKEDFNGISGA